MPDAPGVVLTEYAYQGCLNLRGDSTDAGFRDAVARVVGMALPLQPGTWHGGGAASAFWLGPDEWLLIVPGGSEVEVEQRLRDGLRGRFSVVDVGGGHVRGKLSGPGAGGVLRKSSPYDFHPRNFSAGRCTQTVFAKATALVAANGDGSFDLVFRRSYADYLRRWIADAASEYGYRTDCPASQRSSNPS